MSLYEDTGFGHRDLCTTVMHLVKLGKILRIIKVLASRRESHENPVVSLKGVALLTNLNHKSRDGSETEIEDDDISVFWKETFSAYFIFPFSETKAFQYTLLNNHLFFTQ